MPEAAKKSILKRKIAGAAAARASVVAPAEQIEGAQDALLALFASYFGARPGPATISATHLRLDDYRAACADWTHYRLSNGRDAVLVAMPAPLVLAAADAAIDRPIDPGSAAAPTALDRQLAGLLATRLASIALGHVFRRDQSDAPGLSVEGVSADSKSLALDRSFARLAAASIEGAFAGGEATFRTVVATPSPGDVAPPLGAAGENWRARTLQAAEGAHIACRGVLARETLSAETLLKLRKGGVIALGAASLENLRIEAGGALLARGRLGDFRGRRAIQIET